MTPDKFAPNPKDGQMPDVTTGHHTHRYLRLSLAMVVVALFVSIAVQIVRSGTWLPSISHYFYSPAHNVFVGALIAVSLALVVLAGRDLETIFLDVAAIFAPLIALIPTGATAGILNSIPRVPGSQATPCDPDGNCIPHELLETIRHDVLTYTVVLGIVVALSIVVRLIERNDPSSVDQSGPGWRFWSAAIGPIVAVLVAVVLNVAAFTPVFGTGFPFTSGFPISVHFAATIAFFGAFTLVPATNAIRYIREWARRGGGVRELTTETVSRGGETSEINLCEAIIYVLVPVAMVADILWMSSIVGKDGTGTQVFWGEAIALALFATFWVVQTIERWSDPNQPNRT